MKPREQIDDMLFTKAILLMKCDQLLQPRLRNRIDKAVRTTEQGRTLQGILYKALLNSEAGSDNSDDFT